MRLLFSNIFVMVMTLLVIGCGRMNSKKLAEVVRSEMQRDLVKESLYDGLTMERVTLIHKDDNSYIGEAQGDIKGIPVKFDVTCEYDGSSVLWKANLAKETALSLLGKIESKELKEKIIAAWPEIKENVGRKADELAIKAGEMYNTAKKKLSESLNPPIGPAPSKKEK